MAVVGVYDTAVWQFLRHKLNMFLYLVKVGQNPLERRQEKLCCFWSASHGNLEKKTNCLQRIFLWQVQFLAKRFCERLKPQNLGALTPKNSLWATKERSFVNTFVCYLQDSCIEPFFFDNCTATGSNYMKILTIIIFWKFLNYFWDMIFNQDSALLCTKCLLSVDIMGHNFLNRLQRRCRPISCHAWPADWIHTSSFSAASWKKKQYVIYSWIFLALM